VLKIIKANKNGYPDLIAIKNNSTTFVEVKRPNGKLSELQRVRIQELRSRGINVKVWYEYDKDFAEH
jgi:Holliday junction resolvase-like predicted endonuclease